LELEFLGRLTGWLVAGLAVNSVFVAIFRKARLQDHFVSGYAIAALSLLHASFSVNAVKLSPAALAGVIVATAGMLVSWIQVLLGRRLREREPGRRGRLLWAHATVAAGLGAVLVAHLALNSRLLRGG